MNIPSAHDLPSAAEVALLRESVRETLSSLPGDPIDDGWAGSWPTTWGALDAQGLWSTTELPDGSLTAGAIIAEELGRALYPGPGCEALAAASVLSRAGGDGATDAFGGASLIVFATEDLLASADSANMSLAPMVRAGSDAVLLVATTGNELLPAPMTIAQTYGTGSLDVTRSTVELILERTALTAAPIGDSTAASRGRAARALLYCADTLGCVEHVLARTAEYANQRTTFGVPIGKYQAVAHRLVDHAVTARQIRLLLDAAVAAYDADAPEFVHLTATAETFSHGRSVDVISDCIQLCGGIGFTWEFGHHFYLRRAVQNAGLGPGRDRPARRLAELAQW